MRAQLRARLRDAIPIFFRPGRVARSLEDAYRTAWDAHLAGRSESRP